METQSGSDKLLIFWPLRCLYHNFKGGQTGGRMLLHVAVVFFSSYKSPKTVRVITLFLFGHVTLLCGKCLFIKLSQLSDYMIDTPAYPFTPVRSPIIQPWYYLQWRISAGAKFHPSLHLKPLHRRGWGELAQDPHMQTAAWMGLVSCSFSCNSVKCLTLLWKVTKVLIVCFVAFNTANWHSNKHSTKL